MEICELDRICKDVVAKRGEADAIKEELSRKLRECEEAEFALSAFMLAHGKSKYHVDGLGTFGIQKKKSFCVPKSPEDRVAFFNWLKEKGIFESTITVHSATLNALIEAEGIAEYGEGWVNNLDAVIIPGLGIPKEYEKVRITKERK